MLKRRQQQLERHEEMADEVAEFGEEFAEASSSSGSELEGDEATGRSLRRHNKVMVLSSRGITHRQRHLMQDLTTLMPHAKKENKFDTKSNLHMLNELADLNGCTHCLFFEARQHDELFLWMARTPTGPSVKFYVQNVHTLDELNLQGNCMKGTRPLLSFDAAFDEAGQTGAILKETLSSIFGTPADHRRSKPYYDHIFQFAFVDGRIWFRNYQIVESAGQKSFESELSLIEIGPRIVLQPIKILAGSFRGQSLYQNSEYVTPSQTRAQIKRSQGTKYAQRVVLEKVSQTRKMQNVVPENDLDHVFD